MGAAEQELARTQDVDPGAFAQGARDFDHLEQTANDLDTTASSLRNIGSDLGVTGDGADAAWDEFSTLARDINTRADAFVQVAQAARTAHAALRDARTEYTSLPPGDIDGSTKALLIGGGSILGPAGTLTGVAATEFLGRQKAAEREDEAAAALRRLENAMTAAKQAVPVVSAPRGEREIPTPTPTPTPGDTGDGPGTRPYAPTGTGPGGGGPVGSVPTSGPSSVGTYVAPVNGQHGSSIVGIGPVTVGEPIVYEGAPVDETGGETGSTSGGGSADGDVTGVAPGTGPGVGGPAQGGLGGNGLGGAGGGTGGAVAGGLAVGGAAVGVAGLGRGLGGGGLGGGLASTTGGKLGAAGTGLGAGSGGRLVGGGSGAVGAIPTSGPGLAGSGGGAGQGATLGSRAAAGASGVPGGASTLAQGGATNGAAGAAGGGRGAMMAGGMPMSGTGAGQQSGRKRRGAGYLTPDLGLEDDATPSAMGSGARAGDRSAVPAQEAAETVEVDDDAW